MHSTIQGLLYSKCRCTNSAVVAGDTDLILSQEDLLEVGNGNPLQYSCLGKSHRGPRRAAVHDVTESDMNGRVGRLRSLDREFQDQPQVS